MIPLIPLIRRDEVTGAIYAMPCPAPWCHRYVNVIRGRRIQFHRRHASTVICALSGAPVDDRARTRLTRR
ncbi:hypothetical protein ACFVIM_31125 [Streptomyces sp. NPDC057638]|uniref:hypothetical protein n=1 Tax=Streptomyces sp. NPDC057638 TaxID=3346190 RepID=UPI0036AE9898